jgi:two-component system sensor histidine kinase BaeS
VVSHQIKNSLHALKGFARGIGDEMGKDGDALASTEPFLKALDSLGDLANDVLAMSGTPRTQGEVVPLPDVLSSAVVLARRSPARINVEAPPGRIEVRAHRGQLVHALFNLLDNACRVTPPGEAVEVRVREAGDEVHVEILDGGPGLPPGIETLAGRAPSRDGSGLGLLAARRFLESSGGRLTFERAAGGGTLCRVAVPAALPSASSLIGA